MINATATMPRMRVMADKAEPTQSGLGPISTERGYSADCNTDGTYNVRCVPIFAEHVDPRYEKPVSFQPRWLQNAIARCAAREAEGYLSPLHVLHHGKGGQTFPAGHYRLTHVADTLYEGRRTKVLYADLVQVPPEVYNLIKTGKLPYVSVEIHPQHIGEGNAEIDSLALLPDEVPFFRFPLLRIREEKSNDQEKMTEGGTTYVASRGPVRAYRSIDSNSSTLQGAAMLLKFSEERMGIQNADDNSVGGVDPSKTATGHNISRNGEAPAPAGSAGTTETAGRPFEDGDHEDADFAEEQPGAAPSTESRLERLLVAIAAKLGINDESRAPEAAPEGQPVTHGASDESLQYTASLEGEVQGLTARLDRLETESKRKEMVSRAFAALEPFALGSEWKKDVIKYSSMGEGALNAYVAGVQKSAPSTPPSADDEAGPDATDPQEVLKFSAYGPDAMNAVRGLAREYNALPEHLQNGLEEFLQVQPEIRQISSKRAVRN